jgi:iron complex outermembrane recepter protein
MNFRSHLSALPGPVGLSALLLAGVCTARAQAQTRPADSPGTQDATVLSPFTVTSDSDAGYMSRNTISGTGTNETLLKTPQTIQVANQEVIRDLASDDPMQAIEMTSGSAARRSFNPGDDTFIWGFRLQGSLKDSIPYSSQAIGTLYDVDRIEVIKGPAAMMFGQNAYTGGVVNYVTRKPTKARKFLSRLALGSNNYRSAAMDASGPVTQKFRYRLDVGGTESDYSPRKFGFYHDRFYGAGVEYDLTPKTKLAADLSYGTVNAFRPKTIIDPATLKLIAMPDDYTINQPWSTFPMTQTRGSMTLTSALLPRVDSRTFVAYNNGTNDWVRDLAGTLNPNTHIITTSSAEFDTSRHFVAFGQDFVARADLGPIRQKFLFGGDQRNEFQHNITKTFVSNKTGFNYLVPNYDIVPTAALTAAPVQTKIDSRYSGLYLQDQISVWRDRVIFTVGGRYNEFVQKSRASSAPNTPVTLTEGNKTIGRYGVIVQPFPQDITIYYNHSESFLFNGGVDYRNEPLKPSVGGNHEFGAKGIFFNGALSLSATYFNIELNNVRVVFTQGPGDPIPGASGVKQDGRQTNKGWDLNAGLSRKLGVGVANLIATCYAANSRNELGVKPASAINNSYSLLANYALTGGSLKGFKLGAGYVFKGQRTIASAAGYPGGSSIRLPEYNVVRAFASYAWSRYSLQLNVDNLRDERYVQGAESAVWVQTDPGRSFKLTATMRY